MDFERRLNELVALLSQHVPDSTVNEFRDFVDAREYGVALEFVCDRLSDDEDPVTVLEFEIIRGLADRMGLDRPSIDDVADLVIGEL